MVMPATNLGRSGSFDFLFQRFSAVIILAYLAVIVGFMLCNPGFDYAAWKGFFAQTWVRIFSTLTLLSIVIHAYAGLWTVVTDYMTTRMMGAKATAIRLFCQASYSLILFVYLVWGLVIVWG
jgi:succinate dehydrogenase / fumarate reductase, membrane anchor subunit